MPDYRIINFKNVLSLLWPKNESTTDKHFLNAKLRLVKFKQKTGCYLPHKSSPFNKPENSNCIF